MRSALAPQGHSQWPTKPLSSCIEKVVVPYKVPKKDFLENGRLPVVSQEAGLINGYWNNDQHAIDVDEPIVVFGDHTQVLKLVDFDFVVGADGVKILKPKNFLDASFLRYFLEANPVPSLGYARHYRHISALPVPLPALEEQKRIVAILDQVFAALDRARAHAEANLADSRELLANSLNSLFLGLAASVDVVPLEDVAHPDCTLSYGIVQPGDDVESGLPVVRPVDLKQRVITPESLKKIDPDRASGYARTRLVGGELLLCVRGSTGEVSIAAQELTGANVTRGIVPIRFKAGKVLPEFAYFQFRSKFIRDQIAAKTYGAALMQINIKDLRKLSFIVPPVSVQQEFAAHAEQLLDRASRLCAAYEATLTDLTSLRQSLLQQAFSGQLTQ